MSRVMGVMDSEILEFSFRRSFFGKQILQVKLSIKEWDTNTGKVDHIRRIIVRDAVDAEAKQIIDYLGKIDIFENKLAELMKLINSGKTKTVKHSNDNDYGQ